MILQYMDQGFPIRKVTGPCCGPAVLGPGTVPKTENQRDKNE